jgi:hypothetical protein
MSIFKDTFKEEVQNQLKARQEAIAERTPNAIQYFNSRNAWIRMSSSVNVGGSNKLAQQYVLLGGTLLDGKLRSGIGASGAYSVNSPGGTAHRLGIRTMPGITSIDVKSKSAYGSLKEVVVNFNAWDIKQLEELELLYMRPGYTVLIEWGWVPYLDNSKNLSNNISFYNIINPTELPTKEKIFKDLYDTAVKTHNSNYDSLFGYIKNYSWSARDDGGYDCTATVISVGEVMESLKINYSPFNNMDQYINEGGILLSGADSKDLKEQYSLNILAGLFYEIWYTGVEKGKEEEEFFIEDKSKNTTYNCFRKSINIHGGDADASGNNKVGASDEQVYITLESLCSLINNRVTFKDSNSNSAYITCSVFDRQYDKNTPNTPNSSTGEGGYLLCLGHPLQISMDPTVCLINSPVWAGGIIPDTSIIEATNPPVDANTVKYSNTSSSIFDTLITEVRKEGDKSNTNEENVIKLLQDTLKSDPNEIKEFSRKWHEKYPFGVKNNGSLYSYLDNFLTTDELNKALGESNIEFTRNNPAIIEKQKLEEEKKKANKIQEKTVAKATSNLAYLEKLKPFFYKKDYTTELGIIGNIYVNVNFLYRLAINNNLESKDSKEKNDISLYDFLKQILAGVSSAIGQVNNFDIHIDPQDSVARIIDINYVDAEKSREAVYDKLFTLEMHNIKSTVRSYKLESQIFPDQASVIAIGAQVGGGAMATDNNTMLDFNKGLEDRIIPKKIDPTTDPNQATSETVASQLANLSSILDIFYGYFERLGDTVILWIKIEDADFNTEKADQYKNALKDLIKFYQNLTASNTKNRAIIPTKLSVTMDGIGGLVIGHMFKIPEDLLPKGYKGETLGSKLGYTVTGIGHSVSNNDWTTNIDAQTIILDDPSGTNLKYSDLVVKTDQGKVKTASSVDIVKKKANLSPSTGQSAVISKYGEIGDTSQLTTLTFPYPMYYGSTLVKTTTVHKLVKNDLENIFKDILKTYGLKRIKELKLDQFSGLYNVRNKRGGSTPSIHSWAIAIDLYAAENGLNTPTGTALFSSPEYQQFINIWYKYGWKSFGKELGRDWMHFQVNDAPF